MQKKSLLQKLDTCEYPTEFLVARLLGKKSRLFRNWEVLVGSANVMESLQQSPFYPYLNKYAVPGIWRFLRDEYAWIYRRMNDQLRENFNPYFSYHACSTLIVCLRYLAAGRNPDTVSQELHNSLLHDEIQQALLSGREFSALLPVLEQHLAAFSEHFQGLSKCFKAEGIAGLEIILRNGLYGTVFSQKQPSLLQMFFQHLADINNCMSLAKNLRWQLEAEPPLIKGGSVPISTFNKAFYRKDLVPVLRLLNLKDPEGAAAPTTKLESRLLSHLTTRLRSISYQRTATGEILFYLWEQYRYTRNISMVLHTVPADDEPVRESLVA